jgi:hypothetical protein
LYKTPGPEFSFTVLDFIIIEDLTQYFKKPCVLDVKIGRVSYGEDASYPMLFAHCFFLNDTKGRKTKGYG